jgi:signal transduction histidine kinase
MKGYATTVLEDHSQSLDVKAKDYLERIIRGGARMDRLIEDVLTYSRMSRRQMQLQPVSLQKLLHDIVQQYPEMQAPRADISFMEPLPSVMAHEPSLGQVVSNLLVNAIKFVPTGETPRIKVRAENGGAHVRLWIEDNGIGIKPEHQHRLFGMFERMHADKKYEGTGIGLAIVRKGVERMGGTVGVESDGVTGSQFWLELVAANHV